MDLAIQNRARRGFLALSLTPVVNFVPWATAVRALAVPGAVVTVMAPSTAQAFPVAAVLAVAATVCGKIAASKRGDGGIGASLKATLEYQRVMVQQLSSIQKGLADVLERLNALPGEIRQIFHDQRLIDLQTKIGGSILRYSDEVNAATDFPGGFQAWTSDVFVRQKLMDISNSLDEAIADISQRRWTDAMTSLYLPAALFTSLGIRAALGLSTGRLKFEAQKYLDLMARVEDVTEHGSAAADLHSRRAVIQKLTADLAAEGFVVPAGGVQTVIEFALGQVAVQDYSPPYTDIEGICPENAPAKGGTRCRTIRHAHPERVGAKEAYRFSMKVSPLWVRDPEETATQYAIRQFLPGDIEVFGVPVASQPVSRVDARSPAARLNAANASAIRSNAERTATMVRALLVRHNEEAAYSALNIGSLAALSNARRDVFGFFGIDQ
ncbi:hypothetical protein ACFPOU_23590 [Massilia jejuensis]|uniref:Uncharacterized protein n=1 Tax=Massilia jejuensis TaxID=648894 RepID=A0ABW0PPM3_9BURK